MSAKPVAALDAQSPADAVYLKITHLEDDLIILKTGTTAMAVLLEHIRSTPADDGRHDELDLQDAAIWIAMRLERMAIDIHDQWEAANSLAYDTAYPKIAAQRTRPAVQS